MRYYYHTKKCSSYYEHIYYIDVKFGSEHNAYISEVVYINMGNRIDKSEGAYVSFVKGNTKEITEDEFAEWILLNVL
jgi:hypothetical protein